jgi:hypothetical protein
VAFAAYQYDRLASGEVPLWNPYNNGGLPFIADTQAAVFYPPRLATIALSNLAGGWSYHALELEMTAHVLLYSLLMYTFVRRLTHGQIGSVFGAFVSAVIASYGGYLSAYPPLQLAILEAGIWLPLAALGILKATGAERLRWRWLTLTGFALGLSWMAGHPQTSWFLTYFLIAYFAYQVFTRSYRWQIFVGGTAFFGLFAMGLAAVQLLPGLEYLTHTARLDLTFDAKGNGFPVQDVVQFVFPGIVSFFSPLYVGIVGIILAAIALWRKLPASLFWGTVALLALGLSFGTNGAIFHTLYNLLPGLRFFRGQERAAYLVANSVAVLAGLGAAHIATWDILQDFKATRLIRRALIGLLAVGAIVSLLVLVAWLGNRETYDKYIQPIAFSTVIAGLSVLVIPWVLSKSQDRLRLSLLAALIVFELFTVNIDNVNYEPVPPDKQLPMTPPPLVAQVLADDSDRPFRVDGWRGLHDNFGSLYRLMDMRGISPLFLDGPYRIIEAERINPLAWELFAVRYVFTDWGQLPVPSEIVGSGSDRYGDVNLHRLSDPRPFAQLVYNVEILDSDDFAYALLSDLDFDPRQTIILAQDPVFISPDDPPDDGRVDITYFAPEHFTVEVSTSTDTVLSLSHPDYPGWQATIDGSPSEILRAYGALAAVVVPAGEHRVNFVFDPLTYRIGALTSLCAWVGLIVLGAMWIARGRGADAIE